MYGNCNFCTILKYKRSVVTVSTEKWTNKLAIVLSNYHNDSFPVVFND